MLIIIGDNRHHIFHISHNHICGNSFDLQYFSLQLGIIYRCNSAWDYALKARLCGETRKSYVITCNHAEGY